MISTNLLPPLFTISVVGRAVTSSATIATVLDTSPVIAMNLDAPRVEAGVTGMAVGSAAVAACAGSGSKEIAVTVIVVVSATIEDSSWLRYYSQ